MRSLLIVLLMFGMTKEVFGDYTEAFEIVPGERIAQMVVARHETVEWEEVEILDETERGEGGFGSTGLK